MSRQDLEISVEELKTRMDAGETPVLLDVRRPDEFAICNLPESKLIPLDQLPANLDELDPEDEIVVYCHHGIRSLNATVFLQAQGFSRVRSLAGGIDRWSNLIDPTVPKY